MTRVSRMENSGYRGRGKGVRRAVYRDQQDEGPGSVRQCTGGSAEKRTGLHMAETSYTYPRTAHRLSTQKILFLPTQHIADTDSICTVCS